MTEIQVRQLQADEKATVVYPLLGYAFYSSPPLPPKAEVEQYLGDAVISAVFEAGTGVSCAAYTPMIQNVRGKLFPAHGVWGVSTLPAARRKGYSRCALSHLFEIAREAGHAISVLYAFRESFYERLGYLSFSQPHRVRFSPLGLTLLLKMDLTGKVEVTTGVDAAIAYHAYLSHWQQQTHGMALWNVPPKPEADISFGLWLALARVDGQIVGAMAYSIRQTDDNRELHVHNFYYDNSQGKYLLLEWLARHADQAQTVDMSLPPFEQPETWLPDLNLAVSGLEPALSRILNITRLGGMATGPGEFSARIQDEVCPWNSGCFTFVTVDNKLMIKPANAADCDLSIQAVSALIYGTRDPGDFAVRGWGNPPAATQTIMRRMFPRLLPYLHEKI